MFFQKEIRLPAFPRGVHQIGRQLLQQCPEIQEVRIGLLHLFIKHTSASLTLNENADPDVLVDLDRSLDAIAPEEFPYIHTCEGPDDMPAHVKSSLMGASLSVPITEGRANVGIWQGVCLCEHRNHASGRSIVVTLLGERS